MVNLKSQLKRLYFSEIFASLSLSGAWVALLSARGFSLAEIALTETVFHITSLIFEIPSGILADIFGRKRMLIVSTLMHAAASIIMVFSTGLFSVCVSVIFNLSKEVPRLYRRRVTFRLSVGVLISH